MKYEKIFDLIVWIFIFAAGLFAAYVTFGILQSQAEGKFQNYSVGGAIAGALISWSLLTTLYLQIRSSSTELRDLRNRAEELQHKLIRGAPRPLGFEIEVEERQRIVLARPKEWQPKGGTIFDLELKEEEIKEGDSFAAAFRCFFFPIEDKRTPKRDEYYQNQIKMYEDSNLVYSFSYEFVQLGGDAAGVDSLKIISRQFAHVTESKSKETGRTDRTWFNLSKDEAIGKIYTIFPPRLFRGQEGLIEIQGSGLREGAKAYLNGKERDIKMIYNHNAYSASAFIELISTDTNQDNYLRQLVISVENKDVTALKTNEVIVFIDENFPDNPILKTEVNLPTPPYFSESAKINDENVRIIVQEVQSMRVVCYHPQLAKIYYFEFVDDANDFKYSSATFNRVLNSVRFLD